MTIGRNSVLCNVCMWLMNVFLFLFISLCSLYQSLWHCLLFTLQSRIDWSNNDKKMPSYIKHSKIEIQGLCAQNCSKIIQWNMMKTEQKKKTILDWMGEQVRNILYRYDIHWISFFSFFDCQFESISNHTKNEFFFCYQSWYKNLYCKYYFSFYFLVDFQIK